MILKFEDLHKYDGTGTCFSICNEYISVWREALAGISVERAASVCSGGEVSFFAVLPCVETELVLIDHSYSSMYFAIGKYYLIEKLGAKKAFKLLFENRWDKLEPIFAEANKGLPTKVPRYNGWASHYKTLEIYKDISQEGVEQFQANKNKIAFLHGDLNDLVERGPFDLVYFSNALDYRGRNGSTFEVEKMVKPGGYVAFCGGEPKVPFEIVFEHNAYDSNAVLKYGLAWNYKLCKVPE